eukprot:s278_g44.t4
MNLKQLLNLLMELLGWDDPSWCSFINNVCVFGLAQRAVVVLSPQLPSPRRASKVDREGTCQHSRGSFLREPAWTSPSLKTSLAPSESHASQQTSREKRKPWERGPGEALSVAFGA